MQKLGATTRKRKSEREEIWEVRRRIRVHALEVVAAEHAVELGARERTLSCRLRPARRSARTATVVVGVEK